MVNEINRPKRLNSNGRLDQRLADSTRILQEMELEHEQLLMEMQALRQRANALRLHRLEMHQEEVQQQPEQQENEEADGREEEAEGEEHQKQQTEKLNEEPGTATEHSVFKNQSSALPHTIEKEQPMPQTEKLNEGLAAAIEPPALMNQSSTLQQTIAEKEKVEETVEAEIKKVTESVKESSSEAIYIQEKLNEISRLKAQYKKVENLINTTKKIEEHLTHKSVSTEEIITGDINNNQNGAEAKNNSSTATPIDEKRQLLNAMVDMFQDLSGDLRDQVSSLQDERARIKTLKEELLSKRQQPK